MIDFHTHTILSDGALIPAEHIRRAEVAGYKILGMADHADLATMAGVVPVLLEAARRENELGRVRVLAGVELTHVRPAHIAEAVRKARDLGAQYVVVHGESIAEPVEPGTNRAAIEAGVDYLGHPGLIAPDEVRDAAARGVLLEISGKRGHCLCNGHLAGLARAAKATLVFGSDAHDPDGMYSRPAAERVCLGAGLSPDEVRAMFAAAQEFSRRRTVA